MAEHVLNPLHFYSARDPWRVVRCDDGTLMIATSGDVVCYSDPNHGVDDPADIALFPLIAAAPEMLGALKFAEDILSRAPMSTHFWPGGMHPNEGISFLRDAIAKAEGHTALSTHERQGDQS